MSACSIYRCKGLIYAAAEPERQIVLQGVGRRVDFSTSGMWDKRVPRTQIVLIGAAVGIDADLMEQRFTACISTGGDAEQFVSGGDSALATGAC